MQTLRREFEKRVKNLPISMVLACCLESDE
jgi:hypothetical protein